MVSKVRDNIQEMDENSGFFALRQRGCAELTVRVFCFTAISPSVMAAGLLACQRRRHSNRRPDFMSECQNCWGFSSRPIDHNVRISSI